MSRPRIVLDTNVLISAALQPRGLPAKLLELIAYRTVELCISLEILAEYREVFSRAKFSGLDPLCVNRFLALLADEATQESWTAGNRASQDVDLMTRGKNLDLKLMPGSQAENDGRKHCSSGY